MKYQNVLGIFMIVLTLSAMTVTPALADKPDCQDQPFDFVHSHSLEFSPGAWSVGSHEYRMRISYLDSTLAELGPVYFNAEENAPLYAGQVFLRFFGLAGLEGTAPSVHPDQDTVMQLSWIYDEHLTAKERDAIHEALNIEFMWDGGEYVTVPAGPIMSYCSVFNHGYFFRVWGGS